MQKEKLVRMTVVVYVAMLALSSLLLSADGSNLPIYVFLAVLSLVPLIWGKEYGRIIGVVALMAALGLAVRDYQKGLVLQERIRAIRQNPEASATTESQPRLTDGPTR